MRPWLHLYIHHVPYVSTTWQCPQLDPLLWLLIHLHPHPTREQEKMMN